MDRMKLIEVNNCDECRESSRYSDFCYRAHRPFHAALKPAIPTWCPLPDADNYPDAPAAVTAERDRLAAQVRVDRLQWHESEDMRKGAEAQLATLRTERDRLQAQVEAVRDVEAYMAAAVASDHTLCASFGKAHKMLADALGPQSGPTLRERVAELAEGWKRAYPTDVFPEIAPEETAPIGGLCGRISAGMGRHMAEQLEKALEAQP